MQHNAVDGVFMKASTLFFPGYKKDQGFDEGKIT